MNTGSIADRRGPAGHWSQRPLKLLAAALAAEFLLFLLTMVASLPILLQSGDGSAGWPPALLVQAAQILITVAVGLLFLYWIRAARRRQGAGCPVDWRLGLPFWYGLGLALACGVLGNFQYAQYRPAEAAGGFLLTMAQGFTSTLLLALLFPALEKRFGIVGGALLLLAAKALLTAVELTAFRALAAAAAAAQGTAALFPAAAGRLLFSHLLSDALRSVAAVVAVAAYLSAGRRVLGAWLLAASAHGLLVLLNRAIASSLVEAGAVAAGQTILAVDLPFGLVVLALALLLLAAFRRWKTPGDFAGSAKKLADAAITMGDEP